MGMVNVCYALEISATERGHWKAKFRRVDFGGAIAVILTVSTLLVGLDHGSNHSWSSTTIVSSLIVSIISFRDIHLHRAKSRRGALHT